MFFKRYIFALLAIVGSVMANQYAEETLLTRQAEDAETVAAAQQARVVAALNEFARKQTEAQQANAAAAQEAAQKARERLAVARAAEASKIASKNAIDGILAAAAA